MNCEEFSEVVGQASLSDESRAHANSCASCAALAHVVALASLPPVTDLEVSRLHARVQARFGEVVVHRAVGLRRIAGYALAAGLGAVIASSGFAWLRPRSQPISDDQIVASADYISDVDGLGEEDWFLADDGDTQ